MYNYMFYGYIAYKAYEYVNVVESAISVGKTVKTVYNWITSTNEKFNFEEYKKDLDWVLISDDKNSVFKKNEK